MPDIQTRPLIQTRALSAAGPKSLYERIVFQLLSGMTRGQLDLVDPAGHRYTFGQEPDGQRASVHVKHPDFYRRVVLYGDVGFGEAFVEGLWDTTDITAVISWMILNIENHPTMSGSQRVLSPANLLAFMNKVTHWLRPNTTSGSRKNIQDHYDLSNNFFKQFLDSSMTYSCAYFATPEEDLRSAQQNKYEKLCAKLALVPSDHVLEIGTGWGGFAEYAAKTYGCKITTITISQEQRRYAQDRIAKAGLSDRVEIRLCDYRDLTGQYDKIVSIEMLEAVGDKFLPAYFETCHSVLKPHGILALQVITSPDSRYESFKRGVDWIQKHIFPGSLLPSIDAMHRAIRKTGALHMHDLEDITPHYVKTLSTWRDRLNQNRESIAALGFGERFMRQWNYYFSYCEAAFGMRNISVLQMIYTRPNNKRLPE